MTTIGDKIKQARIEKGWSQSNLAQRLGLTAYQTIQHWEAGRTSPRHKRLRGIAEVLEVSEAWLLDAEAAPTQVPPSSPVPTPDRLPHDDAVSTDAVALSNRILKHAATGTLTPDAVSALDFLVTVLVSRR